MVMEITLAFFLYAYLAFLVLWAFFAFFNLYHVIRFSFWGFTAFFVTFLFVAGSVIVLFLSFEYFRAVDWQQPLAIGGSVDWGGVFNQPSSQEAAQDFGL